MKILKRLTSVLLCLTVFFGAFSVTTASAAEVATDDEVGASVSEDGEVGTAWIYKYGEGVDSSDEYYENSEISSKETRFYNTTFDNSSVIGEGVCLQQEYYSPTAHWNNGNNVSGSYLKYTDSEFDVMCTVAYYYYVATDVKAFTYNGAKYTFSGYVTALCKENGISTTDCVTLFYRYTLYWLYAELSDSTTSWTYKSGVTSGAKGIVYDIEDTLESLTGNVPSYFTCYIFSPNGTDSDGDPFQHLFVVPKVKIALQKTANDTYDITADNSCYSLEGAKYYIYADSSCSKPIKMSNGNNAWIGTNSSGYGVLGSESYLVAGCTTLWCKEYQAPKGYKTDSSAHQFVDNGKTYNGYPLLEANVTDEPISDPMSASLVVKQDNNGNALADARFTVNFYAGYYTESTLPSSATRSWVLKSDSSGDVKLDSDHKVLGSNFYTSDGWLPLGTVTIQETTAPTGYAKDDTLYICQIVQDGDSATKKWLTSKANIKNDSLTVTDPAYIKLQIFKESADPDVTDGNSNYSLIGAVYNIYTDESCSDSSYFGSIKTDADGYGCYGSSSATNNSSADKGKIYYGNNAGSSIELKEGVTYYCREETAPKGYEKSDTVYTFVSTGIKASDGATIYRTSATSKAIKEPVTYGDVKLTKKDSSTKKILTGSQWQLYTSDDELVKTVQTSTSSYMYNTSGTKTILDTDSDGELYVYNLPYGTYYFKEYKAPDGYQISTAEYTFTVTATTSSVEKIAYNSETSGNVELVKEDGNGSVLYNSQWQLYTKSGVPVLLYNTSTGTYQYNKTDSSGEATTMTAAGPITSAGADPSFLLVKGLPKGDYYFIETKAPNGYMPYGKKLEFSVTSSGTQTLNVNLEVIDTHTMLAETGAGGALPFYAAGAGFAALAAVFIIYHFKSKSQKRKENAK